MDRSRSRGRSRPSQVVDPRSLGGGQPADEFAFGPLRARHERRDLQSPGIAPRARARGERPAWRGHSDTETLLAAFDRWGLEEALKRSVGMFALAVWDRQSRKLLLARDRAGEKPLYYGWQRDCLLFGSELKSLRAHPAFSAPIDRDRVSLYLRRGYVPAPNSIYEGIFKLPPGCTRRIQRPGTLPARCRGRGPTGPSARRPTGHCATRSPAATARRSTDSNRSCRRRLLRRASRTCRSARSCPAASIRPRSSH